MDNHPLIYPTVPRHFQVARVHRPKEKLSDFGHGSVPSSARPIWPTEYDLMPMAKVVSADLEEVFRLSQSVEESNDDGSPEVSYGPRWRPTSVGDVVALEHWLENPDSGHGIAVEDVYRVEQDGWSFLGQADTLDCVDSFDELYLVTAQSRVELRSRW